MAAQARGRLHIFRDNPYYSCFLALQELGVEVSKGGDVEVVGICHLDAPPNRYSIRLNPYQPNDQPPGQKESEPDAEEAREQPYAGIDRRESPGGCRERQPDHRAHQQHSADGAEPEEGDVDQAERDGWNARHRPEGDGRAARETVDHADGEWPAREPDQVVLMVVRVAVMHVDVLVRQLAVMAVRVRVDFYATLARDLDEHSGPQAYEHHRYRKLHPEGGLFRDGVSQKDD